MKHNELSRLIIGAAISVHRELGPGLLERIYMACLAQELKEIGLKVEEEVKLPIVYKGICLSYELRLDMMVENMIIIEGKSVEDVHPVHKAQLPTYLKLTNKKLGLLINFNVPLVSEGVERVANGYLSDGE